MIWDDFFDGKTTSENTAWIYDVDFEFLDNDNIKQIIIAGKRSPDHLLRLLIAGIPREKIKFTEHEEDAAELLDLDGIKTTYIFFDLYTDHYKEIIKEKVKEKMNNAD